MMRAGFGSGVIFRILKTWDVGAEGFAGLEGADEDSEREES